MATIDNPQLVRVYGIQSNDEALEVYNDWADRYEADMSQMDHRVPAVLAAVWSRFVPLEDGPILDAGCGTGVQSQPLWLAGYQPITGIDLSPGMMNKAREKGIYADLRQMTLGERLDFADDQFANTLSVGTITPGHAPPESFEELIRVTRPGGRIIFGLRVDGAQDPAYLAPLEDHQTAGRWEKVFQTEVFQTLPAGEPDTLSRVFVFRVL